MLNMQSQQLQPFTITQRIQRKINKVSRNIRGVYEYNIVSQFKNLPPKAVLVSLTYWCNSQCIMCNIWKMKPKNELSLEEWKRILQDPVFQHIERCGFTGGEMTLHPKLVELISLFITSMPKLRKITLVSHGFMTSLVVARVKEIAALCYQKNIELSISISLDGVGKMHEKIRRIPQAFEKATATLFELKKISRQYGFWVGSGSVILRQNIAEVEKMEQWYKDNNIEGTFQIVGFHPTYLRNLDIKNDVDFKSAEQQQLEKFMKKMSKPKSWKDVRSYYWRDLLGMYRDGNARTTPCPFQYDQFAFDSFGDIYYCFSSPKIGNLRGDKTVSDILFDPKNLAFKKRMGQTLCGRCNSGCDIERAIKRDLKKYLWYRLTGRPWYGIKSLLRA